MSKKTRRYTKEFKAEAIQLALSSTSVSGTASDLGMPDATLHAWVQKAKDEGEQGYELPTGEKGTVDVGKLLSENQALRKRLTRLEQEKDILKKAAAYFAKESQ
jgi:transposase